MGRWLDQFFKCTASGSSVGIEFRSGLTTFLAMAYILFVNPQILGIAIQVDGSETPIHAQLLTATALSAAFGSILMGFLARYPIAVAPGMGLNAYFTYTVVLDKGVSWQIALGAVFVSGIVFIMLSLSGFREAVMKGIPLSLKRAVAGGIGFFLAIVGLQSAGFIIPKSATLAGLGDLTSPSVLLMLAGLMVAVALLSRRIPGALMISVLVTSVVAVMFNLPVFSGKAIVFDWSNLASPPAWPRDIMGALDLQGAMKIEMLDVIFTFLFVAFFDTAGTLIGLAEKAGLSDSEGRIPRANSVFTTDAVSTAVGALLGTSTATAYVESAAGMEEGAKTGLSAVFVGLFFLVSIFFWPVASYIPSAATAPALVILGAMMMESIIKIPWRDYTEAVPAFLILISIPFTWSISTGIAIGVTTHVVLKVLTGQSRSIHPVMYLLASVLAIKITIAGG
jgi:AGZA family xanthine/uracil permease-like MFS transporter